MSEQESFGEWLLAQMAIKKWNASQVATYAKTGPPVVHGWLYKNVRPKPESLTRLAKALGLPYDYVAAKAGYPQLSDEPLNEDVLEVTRVAAQLNDVGLRHLVAIAHALLQEQGASR